MPIDPNITIPRDEYFQLRLDSEKLLRLEGGGVDNWDGWGESLQNCWGTAPDIEDFELALRKEIYTDGK